MNPVEKVQNDDDLEVLDDPGPKFPTAHLSSVEIKELDIGYQILKEIILLPYSNYFFKPDVTLFGFYNYDQVIENPICLKEIQRKFHAGEYTEVGRVIEDIKQVVKNGYRFWEGNLEMINYVLELEKFFKQRLNNLPPNLKALYSFDESLRLDAAQNVSDGVDNGEITRWHDEILMGKEESVRLEKIRLNSDLAEIGQFLKLAQFRLGLMPIPQFEIERMLFMAKESTTLATIMTALLCPKELRHTIFFKPIMIYEVWRRLLGEEVERWYLEYRKEKNYIKIFETYGIEPLFWEVFGQRNPLLTLQFDELKFEKKTIVLKALCSKVFHLEKQFGINVKSVREDICRSTLIHENADSKFVSLFSPEIRIYRFKRSFTPKKKLHPKLKNEKPNDSDVDGKKATCSIPAKPVLDNLFSRKCGFTLVANDKSSFISFTGPVKIKKSRMLAVTNLIAVDSTHSLAASSTKKMFDQWKSFQAKPSYTILKSMSAWVENGVIEPNSKILTDLSLSSYSDPLLELIELSPFETIPQLDIDMVIQYLKELEESNKLDVTPS